MASAVCNGKETIIVRIIMTTLFGIEAVTARELESLGYSRDQITVSDGQVALEPGDKWQMVAEAIARLNIHLATAERVLLEINSFRADTFDSLFDQTRLGEWENWIPKDYAFVVNGYSRRSQLFGVPACQSLIKKAIVSRLLEHRGLNANSQLPEDRSLGLIRIQFGIVSDVVHLMIDTSGEGLHKRGYRPLLHEAPIRETLAAAIIRLARFMSFDEEALFDPLCGSGTFPIEAARLAAGIPPGLNRSFDAEKWPYLGSGPFAAVREEARAAINLPAAGQPRLFGSDLSARAVETAIHNAHRAGVSPLVHFSQGDVLKMTLPQVEKLTGCSRHLVICNPPYGERLADPESALQIHRALGRLFLEQGHPRPGVRFFILTPLKNFESVAGGTADKRRKLYNGMIPCTLYQYFRQRRMQT